MKKVMFLTLVSVFSFVSCNKEEDSTKEIARQTESLNRITTITQEFVEVETRLNSLDGDRIPGWLKRLAQHVLNDIKGGAPGAVVGGVFGPIGAGIGAGVGAAAGTLAGMDGGTPPPSIGDDGGASNPSNSYDLAGRLHNGILYDGYVDNYDLIFTEGELDVEAYHAFAESWLIENGYLEEGSSFDYSVDQLKSDLDFIETHEDLSMTEYTYVSFSESVYGEEVYSVLALYYEAMEAASSVASFIDYSIAVEAEVTASGYDEETESLLLSVMSVTRQDIYFWDLNVPE